jgi:NAD(P)-dependent dehydrogenase (short-subunit alcohol dehydrogenase family)
MLASGADRLVLQGPEPRDAVAKLLSQIEAAGTAQVHYVSADFTMFSDVVSAAGEISAFGPIDALINDAGVPGSASRRMTQDGHERTLQVNFLAMALLSDLLRPVLRNGARIVNVASATHQMATLSLQDIELERGYTPVRAYARSKLAIVMYTRWLARQELHLTAVSLQPGVISTGLLHEMFGSGGRSTDSGARNLLLALRADASGGEYYDEDQLTSPSAEAQNDALGDELMAWTWRALRPFRAE